MDDAGAGQRAARAILFFSVAAFIVGGPVYRQVLGGDKVLFRDWIMFRGIALGVIEARFERLRDGRWEDLDFVDGVKRRFGVRSHRALSLQGTEDLERLEREICQMFPGETIRVFARMGTRSQGWVELRYLDALACDEVP